MIKRILYSAGVILAIGVVAFLFISYGRGYRFDTGQKTFSTTGILSASSYPEGAGIYIDGKFVSATNTSLSLPPNWYDVKVSKTGYQGWQKKIKVQGEVVSKIDALLIPSNPSLRALTLTGVSSPSLSPSMSRLAYIVPSDDATVSASITTKRGLWILDLRNSPIGGNPQPREIYQAPESLNLSFTQILWSPDEKQILLFIKSVTGKKETILSVLQISVDSNNLPVEVSYSYPKIQLEWVKLKKEMEEILLTGAPTTVAGMLESSSRTFRFSPDETKIFYEATASAQLAPIIEPALIGSNTTEENRSIEIGKYYVYDIKEDKNYELADTKTFPNSQSLFWYTDSKHIIMIENATISIIDYDGLNKRPAYQGPFEDGFVFPWGSGNKLAILTRLTQSNTLPTLYEVDLR